MNLAPIVFFTFNRFEHTKKTVEALKKNYLAEETELFIFSDGYRNEQERLKVKEVRDFINTINGFKKITVYESKVNKGLANSVITGITQIINKYGRVIVIEDDLITSKYFLKYMNEALNLYKPRKDIWSISGYTPNIEIPKEYQEDVYLTKRGSSWGWATWEDRWKVNDWNVSDYNEFIANKKRIKKFNLAGSDLVFMLNDQMKGRINSWAIRWVYNQFKYNMWTVYPIKSFVKNIGNDLSGTHSSSTDKYDVELVDKMIKLNKKITADQIICNKFKNFYDLTLNGYIAVIIKKVGLYKPARKLRNKILLNIKG